MNRIFIQRTTRVLFLSMLIFGCCGLMGTAYLEAEVNTADNAACLECHSDQGDNLVGTKHALTGAAKGMAVTCIGCHGNWEKHLEDPEANKPDVPSKLTQFEQGKVCASCHQNPHQAAMVTTDAHARAEVSCSNCHSIHGNSNDHLLGAEGIGLCQSCHPTVLAQFNARSAHPLHEGAISCLDCHSLATEKDAAARNGFDWKCQTCHSDYAGPHVFEHPVTYNHLTDGGGCIECHSPHGSPNERLLSQPENGVCYQCHGIPPGHRTAHSGMAMRVDCVNCHTDIHGSSDNRLFLDPMLPATFHANCYASGCHGDVR